MYAPQFSPAGAYRGLSDPRPALPPVSRGLTTAYLVLAITAVASGVAGVPLIAISIAAYPEARTPPPMAVIGLGLFGLWVLCYVAARIVGVVWLYTRWSWLPPEERYARWWSSWIRPGVAAGLLLAPYFNLFWIFVVNLGLCDAVERVQFRVGSRAPSPKPRALAACICEIIPLVNVLVAPFLWHAYMRGIDLAMLTAHVRGPAAGEIPLRAPYGG